MRYNRALSLRRGRLGLDMDTAAAAAATPPSSVSGALGGGTGHPSSSSSSSKEARRQASHTSPSRALSGSPQIGARKLSTSMSNAPSSPAPAAHHIPVTKSASSSSAFSRNDGGRFSLRVGSKTSASLVASAHNSPAATGSSSSSNNLGAPLPVSCRILLLLFCF